MVQRNSDDSCVKWCYPQIAFYSMNGPTKKMDSLLKLDLNVKLGNHIGSNCFQLIINHYPPESFSGSRMKKDDKITKDKMMDRKIFVNRRMQKPQMPKIISTTTMMIDTSPHVGMPISWANASVISAALSPSFSASPLVGVAVLKSSFSSETSHILQKA
uniref:Uncharacterized protein n=1 Tax=Anopheles quadriannulatus TaxID=34691 RepID=A0A182WT67_ANOQN